MRGLVFGVDEPTTGKRCWHRTGQYEEERQVVLAELELANFTSAFRQRFSALFGRKIGRQRAEQYLAGLLGGRASRRNVTSLAQTIDGATARSLGWLLNKSPWATRPIVDAVQTYVSEEIGSES